jgi:hypothetical protein
MPDNFFVRNLAATILQYSTERTEMTSDDGFLPLRQMEQHISSGNTQ